jgi:hypothetical protein
LNHKDLFFPLEFAAGWILPQNQHMVLASYAWGSPRKHAKLSGVFFGSYSRFRQVGARQSGCERRSERVVRERIEG